MNYSFLYLENNETKHNFGEFKTDKKALKYADNNLNTNGKKLLHVINMNLEEQIYIDTVENKAGFNSHHSVVLVR